MPQITMGDGARGSSSMSALPALASAASRKSSKLRASRKSSKRASRRISSEFENRMACPASADVGEFKAGLERRWNGKQKQEKIAAKIKEYAKLHGCKPVELTMPPSCIGQDDGDKQQAELAILSKVVENGENSLKLQFAERAVHDLLKGGLRDFIDDALNEVDRVQANTTKSGQMDMFMWATQGHHSDNPTFRRSQRIYAATDGAEDAEFLGDRNSSSEDPDSPRGLPDDEEGSEEELVPESEDEEDVRPYEAFEFDFAYDLSRSEYRSANRDIVLQARAESALARECLFKRPPVVPKWTGKPIGDMTLPELNKTHFRPLDVVCKNRTSKYVRGAQCYGESEWRAESAAKRFSTL